MPRFRFRVLCHGMRESRWQACSIRRMITFVWKDQHAGEFMPKPTLELGAEFIGGEQFRLGATGTHPNIHATTCFCGSHMQGSDIDHYMSCSSCRRGRHHD